MTIPRFFEFLHDGSPPVSFEGTEREKKKDPRLVDEAKVSSRELNPMFTGGEVPKRRGNRERNVGER